jgi:hypothetical protein
MKKLWTVHKIYHITDFVTFIPLSVTLTLEAGVQVLYLTYSLIIVTICAMLFQNSLNYEEVLHWTQYIPFKRLC